jgi:hypothetical protein
MAHIFNWKGLSEREVCGFSGLVRLPSQDSGGAFGRARVSNTRPWLQSASLKRIIVASYYYLTDVRFLFFKKTFFPPNSVPTPKMEAQGQKSQEPRSGGYIRRLQKKSYGVDRGGLVELGAAMAP